MAAASSREQSKKFLRLPVHDQAHKEAEEMLANARVQARELLAGAAAQAQTQRQPPRVGRFQSLPAGGLQVSA